MFYRALLSVYDKRGLIKLGQFLKSKDIDILSSNKTANLLKISDIYCTEISNYINHAEILDGELKHYIKKIYGGILNDRNNRNHQKDLKNNGISNIDIVVANLYPFEKYNSIENIDIGGVSLIRAAAKNYKDVLVVVDPDDYEYIIKNYNDITSLYDDKMRKYFVAKAFHHIAKYDILIANY